MHKVPFVSQRERAFPNVTCGVAATMMLLRFHLPRARVPSYRELLHSFGFYQPCEPDSPSINGLDRADVASCLRRLAISYRTTRLNNTATRAALRQRIRHAPAMVGMGRNLRRWGSSGHWVVVIKIDEDGVLILDPQNRQAHKRPIKLRTSTFRQEWDGASIQILGARSLGSR